jgi:hypothetical protein
MSYKFASDVTIKGSLVTTGTISASDIIIQGKNISNYFEINEVIYNPKWGNEIFSPSWGSEEIDNYWTDNAIDSPVKVPLYDILSVKSDQTHSHSEMITDEEKQKIQSIEIGSDVNLVTSVSGITGHITLTKNEVGLNLVENIQDIDKQISNLTQQGLDLRSDIGHIHNNATQSSDGFLTWQDKRIIDKIILNGQTVIDDHDLLDGFGSNTHTQIDSKITNNGITITNLNNDISTHVHTLDVTGIINSIDTIIGTNWKGENTIPLTLKSVGFVSGGSNIGIDTFVFSTSTNSVSHGTLLTSMLWTSGTSSNTNGFTSGNNANSNTIYTFNFSSIVTSTQHASLITGRGYAGGSQSDIQSFTIGGYAGGTVSAIDKFNHATINSESTHGNLLSNRSYNTGHQSITNGFTSGSVYSIEHFLFSSNTLSSLHGNISINRYDVAGCSSYDTGFTIGGFTSSHVSTIDKFEFSSNVTSLSHTNLTIARKGSSGLSSNIEGFICGGSNPSNTNIIDKFYFESLINSLDHGDLLTSDYGRAGHEV